MKRTLLILSLITLTATFSQAQYNTKTRIMIYGEGGLNLSTLYQSASSEKALKLSNITRPVIGLYVKTKFPTLMGFDAGVSLSQQGTNTKDSVASSAIFPDSAISKAVLNYAYAYGDALYYFELQGDNTIHAGVGLYAGYAMNGDQVTGSDKKKLLLDDWKRFDFGLQLKTAFNIHEFITLGVQYRIAFLRTLETVDRVGNDNNLRNSVLTLTAALRLFEIKSK
ncbi:porin family protein [Panacibacter ginsenosidivorans]|uniref:Porin family protein n=1 Tax=Panacibacter ginsenosidivorans TaxID=1813871 RepID=A0A5B8V555_9BACT|nr:outer membrane beta-barrel protein [Panacibacter ginsenosidivorans]QEC66185.1 porin family protein [Panacibacter ginsenosidivorans]